MPKENLNMVLLIDDDEVSNYINTIHIKKTNLFEQLHTFTSGEAALYFLNQLVADSKALPELILVDVNMPKMTGWEFVAAYEKIAPEHRQRTKVAMMSIVFSEEDDILLKQYENVVVRQDKPLSMEDFKKLVQNLP